MLTHNELKKGAIIVVDKEPYEVLEAVPQRYAQRRLMIQTKLKSLISGNVLERTVHQGETFEEAEIAKINVKFLYSHKEKFFFCETENPAKRFDLSKEQIGKSAQYLKQNTVLDALIFEDRVINISLPIKAQLKVAETPPGVKGDRAQGGTKIAILETGAQINVPLFVEEGDIIEVNTETGEYTKRAE